MYTLSSFVSYSNATEEQLLNMFTKAFFMASLKLSIVLCSYELVIISWHA